MTVRISENRDLQVNIERFLGYVQATISGEKTVRDYAKAKLEVREIIWDS